LSTAERFDVIVIGGGPGGQKAALQARDLGKRVLLVEETSAIGGECVRRGTIPSKTLRETACALRAFKARTAGAYQVVQKEMVPLESLMSRVGAVVDAHFEYMGRTLLHRDVTLCRGRASFRSPTEIAIREQAGGTKLATSSVIVVATGSRPRATKEIPIDHEHILDSDSFLSQAFLPRTLTVLGAGVIAIEYASIFAALGTQVTMVDRGERPVSFLDPELTAVLMSELRARDLTFIGKDKAISAAWNGVDAVDVTLDSGRVIQSEKVLVAQGRVANLGHLAIENAGLAANGRGLLDVDKNGQTSVRGIYAVGDVIGPPALASSAMEQGRTAVRHAFGLPPNEHGDFLPMAVYTIPEMAGVGLTEEQARAAHGDVIVGRATFDEIARGHIAASTSGLLKLVLDPTGRKLLGVHVVGEAASELVHIGQMALIGGLPPDAFVENTFNFPTMAEAYRVAALDALSRRPA
jgi:NAD(P) transhydrogenase